MFTPILPPLPTPLFDTLLQHQDRHFRARALTRYALNLHQRMAFAALNDGTLELRARYAVEPNVDEQCSKTGDM